MKTISLILAGVLLTFAFPKQSYGNEELPIHIKQDASTTETLANYTTPTVELPQNQWPRFEDDLNFDDFEIAFTRQIRRFDQRDLSGTIRIGGKIYSQRVLRDTLVEFRKLVRQTKNCFKNRLKERCLNTFNEQIRRKFKVVKPDIGPAQNDFAHFTAYYTPTIQAKERPTRNFPWPIFSKPYTESLRRSTRVQIDFDEALKGRGLEHFYAPDLFELYLLHVEGGGRIEILKSNGQKEHHYLSYSGTNGRTWRFISLYMRDQGYIDDLSIVSQRNFLARNPELQEEIYSYCPSYVYFKITDTPPEGSDLVPLSDNRSIATDRNHYRLKGMLAFVQTKRLRPDARDSDSPNPGESSYMDFSRFMLDQDTGGAIRGEARVDLYFGEDEYAARAAQHVNHRGELYFLVKK